jgi:hypothetical protein
MRKIIMAMQLQILHFLCELQRALKKTFLALVKKYICEAMLHGEIQCPFLATFKL